MDQKAAEVPEQSVPPEFPKTRGLMLEGRLGGGRADWEKEVLDLRALQKTAL